MNANEIELINLIRSSNDPDRALGIALSLLADFLGSHEVLQGTSSATLQAVS